MSADGLSEWTGFSLTIVYFGVEDKGRGKQGGETDSAEDKGGKPVFPPLTRKSGGFSR